MRVMHSKKDKQREKTTEAAPPRHGLRLDPAILLYPASILAALVVLYVVSRSIEREAPVGPSRRAASQTVSTTAREGQPASTTGDDSAAGQVQATGPEHTQDGTGPGSTENNTDGGVAQDTTDDTLPAIDLDRLEGPARTVALLRMAVHQKDHALIKQCLDELVAQGDAGVVSLTELVAIRGQAGLWAAEALARIGTPAAAAALLDTLGQTEEGQFKDDLGRRIAGISNHDSWPLLLDTLLQTEDAAVARATVDSLARMADTPVIDEIIARYEAAATEAEIDRLAHLVGNIQSPRATEALLSLAGDVTSAVQGNLQQAAIDALAKVGDSQCASYLLRRLEATAPGEGASLYNAITKVSNPEAYSQLLYAAAGNKEVSAECGQAAAIQALANYPCEETCALLERIVGEGANEKVVAAASRTLDTIRQTPSLVTASAESLSRSEAMLPIAGITK